MPVEIKVLIEKTQFWTQIVKYIYWMRSNYQEIDGQPPVVYADEEELKAMDECHPRCIEILKEFLGSIV